MRPEANKIHVLALSLGIGIVASCAGPPLRTDEPKVTVDESKLSDPKYRQAVQFARWLHNELPDAEAARFERRCIKKKRDKSNPFCRSVRNRRALKRIRDERENPTPPKRREFKVAEPSFKKGRVRNWNKLRRAHVQSVLKGIDQLPLPQLLILAKLGLKESRCPNNAAIAIAATLEDHLPEEHLHTKIAKLYEKGGRCSRRRSADREHFLTRAALFYFLTGRYKDTLRVTKRIPPRDFYVGRPLYWRYRAELALGKTKAAKKSHKRLISKHPFSFHAAVANSSATQSLPERFPVGSKIKSIRSKRYGLLNRVLEQCEILNRYELRSASAILIDWMFTKYRRIRRDVRLYMAELGDSNNRVNILTGLFIANPSKINRHTLKLFYPDQYIPTFEKHQSSVDSFLLLSIARKESLFNPNAVSRADAQGLLQIHPKTAATLSGRSENDLLYPPTNIYLGAKYVKQLLKEMKGSLPLTIAAYNAGEAAVERWRARFPGIDPVLFVDLIPYRETRDYTGYVLSNYYWYRQLYQKDGGSALAGAMEHHRKTF